MLSDTLVWVLVSVSVDLLLNTSLEYQFLVQKFCYSDGFNNEKALNTYNNSLNPVEHQGASF